MLYSIHTCAKSRRIIGRPAPPTKITLSISMQNVQIIRDNGTERWDFVTMKNNDDDTPSMYGRISFYGHHQMSLQSTLHVEYFFLSIDCSASIKCELITAGFQEFLLYWYDISGICLAYDPMNIQKSWSNNWGHEQFDHFSFATKLNTNQLLSSMHTMGSLRIKCMIDNDNDNAVTRPGLSRISNWKD